ncbi:hypothetical protein ACOME3_007701 [Neoechinorhynchus agilis]
MSIENEMKSAHGSINDPMDKDKTKQRVNGAIEKDRKRYFRKRLMPSFKSKKCSWGRRGKKHHNRWSSKSCKTSSLSLAFGLNHGFNRDVRRDFQEMDKRLKKPDILSLGGDESKSELAKTEIVIDLERLKEELEHEEKFAAICNQMDSDVASKTTEQDERKEEQSSGKKQEFSSFIAVAYALIAGALVTVVASAASMVYYW